MDIPNTGAIFTLGKSHLAENTQSYFYIKNDPVRRLTSGANQSAVICESGRLFVWGENHFGQLGVGASSGDIITKPTCVKSLKTLGLKIADIAFGNGWAVILTYSNEIFFTGRNIFSPGTKATENFTSATIGEEKYSIIRKPFRLEEFDDCLSTSEDQENFICISAGNGHFALMTSLGRIIGWGSNEHNQLGSSNANLNEPYEVILESKVKQFVCGPTSTLVLTENGNLYLTGRLSEFSFPQFTELQKNLSPQEEIHFLHISQASEIYIVTNEGGIYRSIESMRHNSLIFQRFYDYDSEENGQVVKLLRGTSFYAALSKANKFYTTFSESGHHLKTFREISKFKNLRTLDIVVGDQHILVHGIPRSANKLLNKTFVIRPDSNANINQVPPQTGMLKENILEETDEGDENGNNNESVKPNTPVYMKAKRDSMDVNVKDMNGLEESKDGDDKEVEQMLKEAKPAEKDKGEPQINGKPPPSASSSKFMDNLDDSSPTNSVKSAGYHKLGGSEIESNNSTPSKKTILTANPENSPTLSTKSRKGSAKSIRFDEKSLKKQNSSERIVRPRTPYPDETPHKPLSGNEEESLDKTSPTFNDSLDNIPETVATFQSEHEPRNGSSKDKASTKKRKLTPIHRNNEPVVSGEEDEQLAIEIDSTDFLEKTVVNEIRFINNGVDVTDMPRRILPKIDSVGSAVEEEASKALNDAEEDIHSTIDEVKSTTSNAIDSAKAKVSKEADKTIESTIEKVETMSNVATTKVGDVASTAAAKVEQISNAAVDKVANDADKTVEIAKEKVENVSNEANTAFGKVSSTLNTAMSKVSSEVDSAVGKVSTKFDSAVSTISEGVDNTMASVSQTVNSTVTKISHKVDDAKQNISNLFSGENKDETPNRSSNASTAAATETSTPKDDSKIDDDERTTASVNSNRTGAPNPFEEENENDHNNHFDPVKRTLGDEIRSTGESGKGKVMQFLSDMKAKGKGMSCRDDKAVRIEDEPPKYTPVDEYANQENKTSKVCTIL